VADIGADDVERYRVEYRTRYDDVAIPATRLYRGARTTLRDFHRAGLLQATVTGKRAADCERSCAGSASRRTSTSTSVAIRSRARSPHLTWRNTR